MSITRRSAFDILLIVANTTTKTTSTYEMSITCCTDDTDHMRGCNGVKTGKTRRCEIGIEDKNISNGYIQRLHYTAVKCEYPFTISENTMTEIENEVLEYVGSFIGSMYGTLRYSDDLRTHKKERRSYISDEATVVKTSAREIYDTILKFKKGELPSDLTDEDKARIKADLDIFTMSQSLIAKEEGTAFSFTMSKHLEEREDRVIPRYFPES